MSQYCKTKVSSNGNLVYKMGAGTMNYNTANQLTSRQSDKGVRQSYTYDAKGNQISGDGCQISWTIFKSQAKFNPMLTPFTLLMMPIVIEYKKS